jgi:hypothetical protein
MTVYRRADQPCPLCDCPPHEWCGQECDRVKAVPVPSPDASAREPVARALSRYRGNENWWRTRLEEADAILAAIAPRDSGSRAKRQDPEEGLGPKDGRAASEGGTHIGRIVEGLTQAEKRYVLATTEIPRAACFIAYEAMPRGEFQTGSVVAMFAKRQKALFEVSGISGANEVRKYRLTELGKSVRTYLESMEGGR